RADPVGDVFAPEPVVAADHHGIAVEAGLAALDIGEVADALCLLPEQPEILDLEPEAVDLDPIDLAHGALPIDSSFDRLSMRIHFQKRVLMLSLSKHESVRHGVGASARSSFSALSSAHRSAGIGWRKWPTLVSICAGWKAPGMTDATDGWPSG